MRSTHFVLLSIAISAAAAAQTGNAVHATFTFPLGSSELDAPSLKRLDDLAAQLRRSAQRLVIEGHSDSTGGPSGIERLSKLRAERIAREFQQRGVPAARLEVKWFAARAPVASNDSEQGRAKNRRADVRLTEQEPPQVVATAPTSARPPEPTPTPEPAASRAPSPNSGEPVAAPVAVDTGRAALPAPAADDAARAAPPPAADDAARSAPQAAADDAAQSAPQAAADDAAQSAPLAAAAERHSDAPRREEAPTLTPRTPPVTASLTAQPALLRPRVVLATAASVVAIAAGATAIGLLVDSASGATALAGAQAQLARTDLVPQSRADWEAHATSLNAAVEGDAVGAGVLGAVAVTAAVTAVVLWVQEANAGK